MAVEAGVAVCYGGPVVELLDESAARGHPSLRHLGPDLCEPEADLAAVVDRARARPAPGPLAQLLLDQRVAAGVGNVYTSETCFVTGHHPASPTTSLDDQLTAVFAAAAHLLRDNLERPVRTTVAGGRPGQLYVYQRAGRPCRRCGEAIERTELGRPPRSTYWCPACQAAPAT